MPSLHWSSTVSDRDDGRISDNSVQPPLEPYRGSEDYIIQKVPTYRSGQLDNDGYDSDEGIDRANGVMQLSGGGF